jgi:hypothetical protein
LTGWTKIRASQLFALGFHLDDASAVVAALSGTFIDGEALLSVAVVEPRVALAFTGSKGIGQTSLGTLYGFEHQLAGHGKQRSQLVFGSRCDGREGIELQIEAQFALPHVADPRDGTLIQKRFAERHFPAQTKPLQCFIEREVLGNQIGPKVPEMEIANQISLPDQAGNGRVSNDDPMCFRIEHHDGLRSRSSALLLTVDEDAAIHLQVHVQGEASCEMDQQILAARLHTRNRLPNQAFRRLRAPNEYEASHRSADQSGGEVFGRKM